MLKIVTLTLNPALDVSSSIHSVAPEIKLRCAAPNFHPGGGGINVSRAIRFLGGDSSAVYTAGGHTGAMLTQLLAAEGIDHRPVHISGITRESFVVYEESTSRQYRFTLPGPTLAESEWRACLAALLELEPDLLVASGSLPAGVPLDFYGELARYARKNGIRLILDTAIAGLERALDASAYLIKPNLRELALLAGNRLDDEAQIEAAGRQLIERGLAEAVLVSLGAGGALLVASSGSTRFHAPVVPIASKVGAGDSMVGGLTLALAQGRSLTEAARFGVAAGSAAVMTPGTQLCRREDAYRLYEAVTLTAKHGNSGQVPNSPP